MARWGRPDGKSVASSLGVDTKFHAPDFNESARLHRIHSTGGCSLRLCGNFSWWPVGGPLTFPLLSRVGLARLRHESESARGHRNDVCYLPVHSDWHS